MKIAIVHNLPPGGQKRALYEQVKRLSKKHRLDLFTLSSTDESFCSLLPYIQKHKTVFYNPPPHFPRSLVSIYKDLPKSYRKLSEMINAGNYDLVYVNPCYLTQAPYVLRYLKIPSIYYCPEPKREFYEFIPRVSNNLSYHLTLPFRLPIKYIDKQNTLHATRILTNSNYSKRGIDCVYKTNSYINYLGVDNEVFKPLPIAKEKMVLTVGDLLLHKGHDFIIESIGLIDKSLRPKLMIIGRASIEKNYLIKLSQKFEVELEIKENISDNELVKLYNQAKLYLHAAYKEPFGLSILEALSCGTKVLAVDEGGAAEIVTSSNLGYLSVRNKGIFASYLHKHLVDGWQNVDRNKLHQLIKNKWSWTESIKELEKHFLSVIR